MVSNLVQDNTHARFLPSKLTCLPLIQLRSLSRTPELCEPQQQSTSRATVNSTQSTPSCESQKDQGPQPTIQQYNNTTIEQYNNRWEILNLTYLQPQDALYPTPICSKQWMQHSADHLALRQVLHRQKKGKVL